MVSEYVALDAGSDPALATQLVGASAHRQFLEPCQICSGRAGRYRHDWLKRCSKCGVLSADLPVAIPERPHDGGLDEDCRLAGLEPLRHSNNARLLEALARHGAAPGQRLLDVGCGAGILVGQAVVAGYDAEGVEPDANVLRLARRNGKVRHGYFPSALEPDEAFDVIVFNDVFEHIPNLTATLADIASRLRPGGLLCLNCPDKRGLFFRVAAALDRLGMPQPYDRLWQRGLPSPHVWYFEPAHLAHATRGFGLTHVEDVRLATVKLDGLWERIRCGGENLLVTAAAFVFTLATYPLAALLPSDATACVFRKDG
jgi:SAM-dependent methyltransferase